jgi:hypothetical protein
LGKRNRKKRRKEEEEAQRRKTVLQNESWVFLREFTRQTKIAAITVYIHRINTLAHFCAVFKPFAKLVPYFFLQVNLIIDGFKES